MLSCCFKLGFILMSMHALCIYIEVPKVLTMFILCPSLASQNTVEASLAMTDHAADS